MTNNEAWIEIDEIITFREIYGTDATVTGENKYEALRMAQEALEQQRTGEWKRDLDGTFLCSECGSGYKDQPTLMGKPMFVFCPICGARMQEVTEE